VLASAGIRYVVEHGKHCKVKFQFGSRNHLIVCSLTPGKTHAGDDARRLAVQSTEASGR
jgi:hypothetical protein